MLIEFTVGNFKSFRDRTTFSMIAANLTSEDPTLDRDNIIPIKKDLRLLKTAALYGANASGKSNFGVALRFMRQFILDSSREASTPGAIGLEPFLLDIETREMPSFFEIVFLLDGRQFRYGFEANKSHIVSEWLFHVPKTKEVGLFVREEQEIKVNEDVKTGFKEGKGLEIRTRKEALFLSVVAQFNGKIASQIQNWFSTFAVTTALQDDDFLDFTINCLQKNDTRTDILSFLKTLDLGIDDLRVPDPLTVENTLNENVPNNVPNEFKERLRSSLVEHIFAAHYIKDNEGKIVHIEVFDTNIHESQGTRKIIALSGPLKSILAHGQLMFIDELDARLHPLMTRRIIEMFHSPLTNPKGAQLIFATHDTNLLDKNLFRRDQIWFTEKDQQGATHLDSLADYRVRNDAAFEKNYLEGRYGAIPFLGDLTRLPWAIGEETPQAETERELVDA